VSIAKPSPECEALPMPDPIIAIDTHPEPTSRMLGKWMSTAMVVGSMVGSGIYLLPTTLAPFGPNMVVAFVVTGLGTMCLAFALARLAARIPGGPFVQIDRAFGEKTAFVTLWCYAFSQVTGVAGVAVATAGALGHIYPAVISGPPLIAVALGSIAALLIVNLRGARSAGTLQIVTVLIKLLPLLAVMALAGTLRVVPESADPSAPRLDRTGALIALVSLGVLVYSIIEAPTRGWSDVWTIAGLALGLLGLAGFVAFEVRRAEPLLDPRLFTYRGFAAGTITITVQFFAFFGFIFLLLQYLQLVLADSPLVAALSLVPLAFGLMPTARVLAPRLAGRIGTARTSIVGLVVAAAAFGWLATTLDAGSSYWPLLVGLVPLGAGMALAMTPATAAITDALPREKQGVGSAMNDLARELGGALGIAVLGSVLQSGYRTNLDVTGLPAPAAEQARSSLALATHLGPRVAASAESAFVDGLHVALVVGAVALLAAAAAVIGLHRGQPVDPG